MVLFTLRISDLSVLSAEKNLYLLWWVCIEAHFPLENLFISVKSLFKSETVALVFLVVGNSDVSSANNLGPQQKLPDKSLM